MSNNGTTNVPAPLTELAQSINDQLSQSQGVNRTSFTIESVSHVAADRSEYAAVEAGLVDRFLRTGVVRSLVVYTSLNEEHYLVVVGLN